MTYITKTFTQEEKETLRRAIIKVEKVRNRFRDYITTTEVKYWWRPNKKREELRKRDFHKDSYGLLVNYYTENTHRVVYGARCCKLKELNTLLQLCDTVTMDVKMVESYLYFLEQLEQEGVNNDYY